MIDIKEKDEVILKMPDAKHIACLKCKWGCMDYLSIKCVKYPICKPDSVYYENAECEKFENIK